MSFFIEKECDHRPAQRRITELEDEVLAHRHTNVLLLRGNTNLTDRITELEDELAMCKASNQDYARTMADLETRLDEAEWREAAWRVTP